MFSVNVVDFLNMLPLYPCKFQTGSLDLVPLLIYPCSNYGESFITVICECSNKYLKQCGMSIY